MHRPKFLNEVINGKQGVCTQAESFKPRNESSFKIAGNWFFVCLHSKLTYLLANYTYIQKQSLSQLADEYCTQFWINPTCGKSSRLVIEHSLDKGDKKARDNEDEEAFK
jgi:hypothetical protein